MTNATSASRPEPPAEGALPSVIVGTMNFGRRTPEPEAKRIVERALERGVRSFDTANMYNEGESEAILGRALGARRGEVSIATKVGLARLGGRAEGLAPARLPQALDESLRRLGTDHVDLYYLHAPDHAVPIEATLGAVASLLESGKVKAWGVSNYAAWQVLEMIVWCDARGVPRPALSQVIYNLLVRQLEIEYFAFARRYELASAVYNPLAGGLLAGHHDRARPAPPASRFDKNPLYQRRYWTDRFFELAAASAELARDEGISPVALAYGWLAGRPGVDAVIAGPADVAQLDAALDGCARPLSAAARKKLDGMHREYLGTDANYAR
ncbi:MAG: aldo/keto reductase [Polyangiaceae bacterium]|nr:aldo/keto reductase [Polyangiaceae bacterium]